MTKQVQTKISDSEWEIMRVIWTIGPTSALQINDILAESMDWKPATIKTLLGRLVKKGILKTEADGKRFIYHSTVSETDTVKSAAETLFSHICAKQVGRTLAEMLEESELTAEDVAQIRAILDEKKTVTSIACNCIPGQCECGISHQTNE